jgi:hypothetical protein
MTMRCEKCIVAFAVAVELTVASCAATPVRHALTVGHHPISIVVPTGWQLIDRGGVIVMRSDDAEIQIEDLGPVGPLGVRREVERARELWREGRDDYARWRLRTVPVPDALFATAEQREEFWSSWSEVSHEGGAPSRAAVDAAFDRILAYTSTLEHPDVDALASAALERDDPDARRDVALRTRRIVDGHSAVVLDTWYRLSHTSRQRVVMVFDDGCLLELRTERQALARSAVALERVLGSLRFEAGVGTASADSASAKISVGR